MRVFRALALATVLTVSTTAATFAGDGGGYAQPARPNHDTAQGDGGGYAQPARPNNDAVQGDGGGYSSPTAPTAPAHEQYGEVWA